VSAKSSTKVLGGALDAARFISLLERDVAFAIPHANARIHWHLGALETTLEKSPDKFWALDALLGSLTDRREAVAAPRSLPDQKLKGRHTMASWLAHSDDKLLHWPIRLSPRIDQLLRLPEWLVDANWLKPLGYGDTFDTKLQLVPAHRCTIYHRDYGGKDTWMKLLLGKVLVACWSQADGARHGLDDNLPDSERSLDWERFRRMESARLFLLTKGDVLVMPAGTYHYVYTVQRKIVVAGDFLDGSCWERRLAVVARDKAIGVYDDKCDDIEGIKRRWEQWQASRRTVSRASTSSAGKDAAPSVA